MADDEGPLYAGYDGHVYVIPPPSNFSHIDDMDPE